MGTNPHESTKSDRRFRKAVFKSVFVRVHSRFIFSAALWLGLALNVCAAPDAPIARHALVERHIPVLHKFDPTNPFTVGNGQFAFTADVTGLQTFDKEFENTTPLGTLSQWAWHTIPNTNGWSIEKFHFTEFDSHGRGVGYADAPRNQRNPEITWLRKNPHRLHLGKIALVMKKKDGSTAVAADLTGIEQTLDLWNGELISRFSLEGLPVEVHTVCHPERDLLSTRISSPLLTNGQVGLEL